jgi:hypothetical protein
VVYASSAHYTVALDGSNNTLAHEIGGGTPTVTIFRVGKT